MKKLYHLCCSQSRMSGVHSLVVSTWVGFLLLAATACEEPVDLQLAIPSAKLVVLSNFTANKDLRVSVTASQSVAAPRASDFVDNATVRLFEEQSFIQELALVEENSERYYSSQQFSPVPGIVYTIEVSAPGYTTVTGESQIPPEVSIYHLQLTELTVTWDTINNQKQYRYYVEIGFDDPVDQRNFYHLSLEQEFMSFSLLQGDTVFAQAVRRPITFNPRTTNNLQIVHYDGSLLFEDTPFNGEAQLLRLPVTIQVDGGEEYPGHLFAELRSVTEEYYLFHTSLSRQQNAAGQPFTDPVLLFNNIKNGHGVFAGYSSSQASASLR